MNPRCLVCSAFVIGFLPLARAQNAPTTNAAPEVGARPAAPAFLDAVTFKGDADGERHTLTVMDAPSLDRIDAPDDRLAVLYEPATQHYTGLESSNYTYWEFSWPAVRAAVQGTARYATRLRNIGPELMEEGALNQPATNADPLAGNSANPTDTVGGDDDQTGYVWRTTIERKRIAGFDCMHWVGETVAGESVDAWCTPGLQPPIERAMATLKEINEPMALVPVRELVPTLVFVAWKALTKAGVTPIDLKWGGEGDMNHFAFVSVKQREGKISYFQIPPLYRKTTLLSMDGIGNQKPTELHRSPDHGPTPIQHNTLTTPGSEPLNLPGR
jgi:hypothetical protein